MRSIPLDEYILVAHDGFADTVGLIFYATELQEQVACHYGALEFERHSGCRKKLFGGTDIMKEARKIISFEIISFILVADPFGEMFPDNRSP